MDNPVDYPWQSAYLSGFLEFDTVKMSSRVAQALRVIEERLKTPLEPGGKEHQAILDARSGIAMLQASMADKRVH
jgi:hypothetical protein